MEAMEREIRTDSGFYMGSLRKHFPVGLYNPATSKARVFGFDGQLHYVNDDGVSYATSCPAIAPFDDVQTEWPKMALYFVEMCGIQFAVMATTMREACGLIEKANGWD